MEEGLLEGLYSDDVDTCHPKLEAKRTPAEIPVDNNVHATHTVRVPEVLVDLAL